MFLHSLTSQDPRFKTLRFHDGMNLLLADRTDSSTSGDSRNGAGKSSFVKLLRYLMGGTLDKNLKKALKHSFTATVGLGPGSPVEVCRRVSPGTEVQVDQVTYLVSEWRSRLGAALGIPAQAPRPTAPQVFAQLFRTYFQDAVRTFAQESDLDCGIRIGYLLGLSPEVLCPAREIAALEKHGKSLRSAIKAGALPSLSLSVAELRAQLAQAEKRRQEMKVKLSGFRVDEQYADHQTAADRLSKQLRDLNDTALALTRRQREIAEAAVAENLAAEPPGTDALQAMYQEVGLLLPQTVTQRFEEVADFHTSVIQNRRMFLESELQSATSRLDEVRAEISRLDAERAKVMELLEQSMALETFRAAEVALARQDATVASLEERLEQATALEKQRLDVKDQSLQAQKALVRECEERSEILSDAMMLFSRLGEEIYSDRSVYLLLEPSEKGVFKVVPRIDGDASTGISEVKVFVLDLVCLVSAIRLARAPRVLVHDSLLFDSMDDRQVASCLNIGARLADEIGFQYIVTMNSDRLAAVEKEGFDRRDYVIDPVLTDKGDAGGLFGFRFV